MPRIAGFYVDDLATVEVAEWPVRGAFGVFVNLEGTGGVNDLQILDKNEQALEQVDQLLQDDSPDDNSDAPPS